MWEFFGESDPPAINDVIATTIGGVAIGEITHRVSDVLLDDRERGFRRFLREAGAFIINPMKVSHVFCVVMPGESRIHITSIMTQIDFLLTSLCRQEHVIWLTTKDYQVVSLIPLSTYSWYMVMQ